MIPPVVEYWSLIAASLVAVFLLVFGGLVLLVEPRFELRDRCRAVVEHAEHVCRFEAGRGGHDA